jgi:hypothetical protein
VVVIVVVVCVKNRALSLSQPVKHINIAPNTPVAAYLGTSSFILVAARNYATN